MRARAARSENYKVFMSRRFDTILRWNTDTKVDPAPHPPLYPPITGNISPVM
jgi:hypothetical protein